MYRLFVIFIGIIVLISLFIILEKTKIGAKIRASVDDPETAQLLKINTNKILFYTFALGCGLAGLAGITVAPILGVEPGMDMEVLVLTLIVVVVGGPGSLKGALVGALLIGFVDNFGKVYIPEMAQIIIYAVMALTLLFKPNGLYNR
jgi:branched-chain amino acid transport system permease protein